MLISNADQLSVISLLLIYKSPPCETMFRIFEKEGNTIELNTVLNVEILPPLKRRVGED